MIGKDNKYIGTSNVIGSLLLVAVTVMFISAYSYITIESIQNYQDKPDFDSEMSYDEDEGVIDVIVRRNSNVDRIYLEGTGLVGEESILEDKNDSASKSVKVNGGVYNLIAEHNNNLILIDNIKIGNKMDDNGVDIMNEYKFITGNIDTSSEATVETRTRNNELLETESVDSNGDYSIDVSDEETDQLVIIFEDYTERFYHSYSVKDGDGNKMKNTNDYILKVYNRFYPLVNNTDILLNKNYNNIDGENRFVIGDESEVKNIKKSEYVKTGLKNSIDTIQDVNKVNIGEQSTINKRIMSVDLLYLNDDTVVNADIRKTGSIRTYDNVVIHGSIRNAGTIILGENTTVHGRIKRTVNSITAEKGVVFKGNVQSPVNCIDGKDTVTFESKGTCL